MHPKYKYAHSAFLALSGSHSVATVMDGAVGEGISSATASHHGRRPNLGSANPLGAECVPTALRPNWNSKAVALPRKKKTIKADVGIPTPKSKTCPGLYKLCEVDETSLLGGRCTTSSSRRVEITSEEEKLQECVAKCPGNELCDCLYGEANCTYSTIATFCRNKDHFRCLTMSEDEATLWEFFYCPIYYCLDGIDEEKGDMYDYDYEVCMTCVGYKSFCDYCKEVNGSYSGCAEGDMYNVCKNAPIDKTYHYSQNCTDSLDSFGGRFSWDENGDSKGDDNGDKNDGSGVGNLSDNGDTTDSVDDGNGEVTGTGINTDGADAFVESQEDKSSSAGKAVVGTAVATFATVSMGIFNS